MSQPWSNEPLRDEYEQKYSFDEAYRWLCEALPEKRYDKFYSPWFARSMPEKYRLLDAAEAHHIHQAKTGVGKWDVWSNFISLHRATHNWMHANPHEGRVICLYAKWQKAIHGNPEDFDLDELRQASGKNYPEYIGTLNATGRVREMRDEMVTYFRAKGAA